MHIAEIIDIGDIDPRSIAAPLFQFGLDVIGLIRNFLVTQCRK